MRFTVRLHDELIGFSEIESGDPSMGCAYGKFVPADGYRAIQEHCVRHRDKWESIPGLAVEVMGVTLECNGGFQIVDFSPELGNHGIELHLLGITTPPYDEIFPNDLKKSRNRE
jgi:hypothetical protein